MNCSHLNDNLDEDDVEFAYVARGSSYVDSEESLGFNSKASLRARLVTGKTYYCSNH